MKAVRAWAEGRPSTFDPKADLEPLLASGLALADTLPVNVFTRWLADRTKAPRVQVRAIASLFQMNLEVERDGDRLQELFAFYAGLGLPVYLGQLGLPGSDEAFLAMGRELEGKACASPFGTAAADWQIAARKNWNWGEKNLGIRDEKVLAAELLKEPDVAALVPRMKAMPSQRIAVVGHSFTMQLHWSTPGAFVPIVTAMFAQVNPGVEFRQFQGGGLTSTRAVNRFYADVVAWKPQQVLLVVINRTDEDLENFRRLGRGLAEAGAKVLTFDDVHDPKGTAERAAGPGARGRARDRHDRDRGEPAPGRRPRPRAVPVPRRHPHDGALSSADGEAVARVPGGCARAGADRRALSMDIRIFDTKQELGRAAAERAAAAIGEAIARAGEARVIAATGASQFEFLDALTATPGVEWGRVEMFHLDEYVGVSDTHPASFRRYLRERIVERVHPRAFHFLAGDAADPVAECRRVGALLARAPIDVAFVGIGENGHLAFNDPPADFETEEPYLVVELDEACRRQQLGEGWFATLDDVPRRAISMSIRQILKVARDPLHRARRAQGEGGAGLPRGRGQPEPPVVDPAGARGDDRLPRSRLGRPPEAGQALNS